MNKNKNNGESKGMLEKNYQKDMLETVNEILEMDIEINNLKELLAIERKLKELMVEEIDELKNLLSSKSSPENDSDKTEQIKEASNVTNINEKREKLLPLYGYTLIDSLRNDQKDILFIYNEMMNYAENKEYTQATGRLGQFSSRIKEHYHYSEKELYSYLRSFILQKYPKRERAFNELCLEMKNIALEIFVSISQSPNIPINDDNHQKFIEEFRLLGKKLNRRIHREESVLFVMYEESNECDVKS